MNVGDALFMFQFFACVGIFFVLMLNTMRACEWFGLDWTFLLFAGYLIAWLVGFVAFAGYPERLVFSQLHKFEGWLLPLVFLWLVVHIFFTIKGNSLGVVKAYKSSSNSKDLYIRR